MRRSDQVGEWLLIYEGGALIGRKLSPSFPLRPVTHMVCWGCRRHRLGWVVPVVIVAWLGIHFWSAVKDA